MAQQDPVYDWILRLHQQYPSDMGVLAPAFLNLVVLTPGQAMFLPAGVLHAYLDGTGLELMANSDNVLRGGLTPKHVDVPQLLNVLDFSEMVPEILTPVLMAGVRERVYPTTANEFTLSVIEIDAENTYSHMPDSAEILLCTQGEAVICDDESGEEAAVVSQGVSVLIHASADKYTISGEAVIYKAAVPS